MNHPMSANDVIDKILCLVGPTNVKFRFAFAPCIVSVAILSLTCVVVSCLVVGLCDTS